MELPSQTPRSSLCCRSSTPSCLRVEGKVGPPEKPSFLASWISLCILPLPAQLIPLCIRDLSKSSQRKLQNNESGASSFISSFFLAGGQYCSSEGNSHMKGGAERMARKEIQSEEWEEWIKKKKKLCWWLFHCMDFLLEQRLAMPASCVYSACFTAALRLLRSGPGTGKGTERALQPVSCPASHWPHSYLQGAGLGSPMPHWVQLGESTAGSELAARGWGIIMIDIHPWIFELGWAGGSLCWQWQCCWSCEPCLVLSKCLWTAPHSPQCQTPTQPRELLHPTSIQALLHHLRPSPVPPS